MVCYCCSKEDWHKRNDVHKEMTFLICKNCGNACYEVDISKEQEMKDYYIKNYRGKIGPMNLLTTSRKLNYIKDFLKEYLKERCTYDQNGKLENPLVMGDAGCATGYIVDWFRRQGHKATGAEWTLTMRRFAEHFYGIPITEELQTNRKYDIIVMYKTLEHMMAPDEKIKHYRSLLKEDGHMLISIPRFFHYLEEPGGGSIKTKDLFFHKDHINIFSYTSVTNLFKAQGFEIVKENLITYGQSFLLKKTEKKQEIIKEDWKKVDADVTNVCKAIEHYNKGQQSRDIKDYRKALDAWPLFPEVYQGILHNTQVKKDIGRARDILTEALKVMPDNVRMHALKANWLYQNEAYAEALEEYNYIVKHRLGEDFLIFKGWCHLQLNQYPEAMEAMNQAHQLNPEKWSECMKWLCHIATTQPTWDERAKEELKEKFFLQNKDKIMPKDPLFDEEPVKEASPV